MTATTGVQVGDQTQIPLGLPADDDTVLGTDVSKTAKNANGETRAFKMSALSTYIASKLPTSFAVIAGTNWPAASITSTDGGAGNAAAIQQAMVDAVADGSELIAPTGSTLIDDDIVLPDGLRFDMKQGGRFTRYYEGQSGIKYGMLRSTSSDFRASTDNLVLSHIELDSAINPNEAGIPFRGNGITGCFRDSTFHDIDVSLYHGDQAMLLSLFDTDINKVHVYTEDTAGGSGGCRIIHGRGVHVGLVTGTAGDDLAQIVPRNNSDDTCVDIHYHAVIGDSHARVGIVFLDTNCTGNIFQCSMRGVSGIGRQRGFVFANASATGTMQQVHCAAVLDGVEDTFSEIVYVYGPLEQCTGDFTVRNVDESAFRMEDTATGAPTNNEFRITSGSQQESTTRPLIFISEGSHNTFIPNARGGGPDDNDILRITGGAHNTVRDGNFSLMTASQIGVRMTVGDNHRVTGNTFDGSGSAVPISWAATPAVTGWEFGNDLNGMTPGGVAPAKRDNQA